MKTVMRIDSCLRANYRFASVFLSVGMLSFGAVTVRALPKDTVVATISTGNVYVGDVVVSPDGKHLYGINNDNKTVMVISTATNEVTSTIAVGNLPFGVAVSPDSSTLYVSNAQDGTVSVIATATGTVTKTIAVGHFPEYLAVSPDGSQVYVPNHNDSTVSIIDAATNRVAATIAVPYGADNAGFSQSGINAYVSSVGARYPHGSRPYLNVFDFSTETLQSSIELKTRVGYNFAINSQGHDMYLVERDRVVIFNTNKNKNAGFEISVPAIEFFGFDNSAVTPDGQYLYEPVGPSVYLVDVVNKAYVNSFTPGGFEASVAIAPNGNYAYFPDFSAKDILVVDISPQ